MATPFQTPSRKAASFFQQLQQAVGLSPSRQETRPQQAARSLSRTTPTLRPPHTNHSPSSPEGAPQHHSTTTKAVRTTTTFIAGDVETRRPPFSVPAKGKGKGKGKRPHPSLSAKKDNTSRKRQKQSKNQPSSSHVTPGETSPIPVIRKHQSPRGNGDQQRRADKETHTGPAGAEEGESVQDSDTQARCSSPLINIVVEAKAEASTAAPPSGSGRPEPDEPELPSADLPSEDEDTDEVQEAAGAEEAGDDDQDDDQALLVHNISNLRSYKLNKDKTVNIEVKWDTYSRTTWEPEINLQDDLPEMLYKFWDKKTPEGRDTIFGDAEPAYHVFKVAKHRRRRSGEKPGCYLHVHWVGYRPTENTWEPENKVKEVAPIQYADYWDSVGGRDLFSADGRKKDSKMKKSLRYGMKK